MANSDSTAWISAAVASTARDDGAVRSAERGRHCALVGLWRGSQAAAAAALASGSAAAALASLPWTFSRRERRRSSLAFCAASSATERTSRTEGFAGSGLRSCPAGLGSAEAGSEEDEGPGGLEAGFTLAAG